jgi:peptide/nickel transport system permease protein
MRSTNNKLFWEEPWEDFKQLVWPIVTVGYRNAAVSMRMTRSTVLEVMREDYIRTAWAKGLQERLVVEVLWKVRSVR